MHKKSGPQSKGFKVYITLMCPQAGILIETKRELNKTTCDPYNVEAIRMPVWVVMIDNWAVGSIRLFWLLIRWFQKIFIPYQTYFVFIEMNLQCRYIHVATDIHFPFTTEFSSASCTTSERIRTRICQVRFFAMFLSVHGVYHVGYLKKGGQNYSVTHEHFAVYCTVWMVKI